MPVNETSIVGQCVLSGERINVPDLYTLDEPGSGNNPWGFVHDRTFDDKYRYQTRSVLAVPMISARDEVIGVIQLINKRAKGWIAAATRRTSRTASCRSTIVLGGRTSRRSRRRPASRSRTSSSTRRSRRCSTASSRPRSPRSSRAIRRRPVTPSASPSSRSGSPRRSTSAEPGQYREVRFSRDDLTQIEYAALLHDFGKVGVREHVLVKAKKLYEHERELILQRFQLIKRGYKIEGLETQGPLPDRGVARAGRRRAGAAIDTDDRRRVAELDDIIKFILAANEPTVLEQGGFERIAEIARHDLPRRGRLARCRSSRATRRAACRSSAAR